MRRIACTLVALITALLAGASLVHADFTGKIVYAHIDPDDPDYGHISVQVAWDGCDKPIKDSVGCQWFGDAELTSEATCPKKPVQLDDTKTLWVSARRQDNGTVGIDDHPDQPEGAARAAVVPVLRA